MVYFIEKNENNKFEYTMEDLTNLMTLIKKEGYDEGYNNGIIEGMTRVLTLNNPISTAEKQFQYSTNKE